MSDSNEVVADPRLEKRTRRRFSVAERKRLLAETVARVTGFGGRLVFDASKPDGTPRKLMDVSRLAALGSKARISLEEGLRDAYGWFVSNKDAWMVCEQ